MRAMSSSFLRNDQEQQCPLATVTSFVSAIIIIIGLVLSYLLQVYRIVKLGTSKGLSFSYLGLGYIGVLNALANVITLQVVPLTKCCHEFYSARQCFANSSGLMQVGSQVMSMGAVLLSFWMYLPRPIHFVSNDDESGDPIPEPLSITKSKTWRTTSYGLLGIFAWGLCICILSATVLTYNMAWAAFLGFSASFCAIVQYVPQFISTIRHKSHGALSIPMMVVQTPGGFLIGYLLSRLPGTNWTSYMMYVVSASLQAVLLSLCFYYHLQNKKTKQEEEALAVQREEECQRAVRVLEEETGP
ncbi:CTNS domain-containing protein [Schizosaccharomyces octosporus yFS286]|uniref:CTNS domain-containing protein n=1 Tax=Schizosaccharomyces octosporus (strain yFS286) TaxID=483514 RepID=S9R988_SCHOY|nr:CTNS domain-containing protein [Schizosaccharomyces octosporus yFS286]EPX74735.1 CTNS domain-containing protein [Schizosaccharomyces octosporus yFS286]